MKIVACFLILVDTVKEKLYLWQDDIEGLNFALLPVATTSRRVNIRKSLFSFPFQLRKCLPNEYCACFQLRQVLFEVQSPLTAQALYL